MNWYSGRNFWAFIAILSAIVFFGLMIKQADFLSPRSNVQIVQDVERLATVLQRIDADCKIIGFDYDKNDIDFLTFSHLTKSKVGSMLIEYPDCWRGPYLPANPRVQGKLYQIVKTASGYFIVPGEGVRLDNGLIVGKDIILNETTDMHSFTKEHGILFDQKLNKPLAHELVSYINWLHFW